MPLGETTERLRAYHYSEQVITRVLPLAIIADRGEVQNFERHLAQWVLEIINKVTQKITDHVSADQCFTLLLIYLNDHCRSLQLSKDAEQILVEGNIFHHLGEDIGTDLALMKSYATNILVNRGTHD